jgi:hypothetical protein
MGMANVKNVSAPPAVANSSSFVPTNALQYTIYGSILIVLVAAFFYFQTSIQEYWKYVMQAISSYYSTTVPSATVATSAVNDATNAVSSAITAAKMASSEITHGPPPSSQGEGSADAGNAALVNKMLPSSSHAGGAGGEVFNVAANRFTYYDAEPLCKAMGAELATYEQVKEAWSKGADWCNYGWVKGQMAVYPTAESTYAKLQSGPEEERMSCGTTGVNGGYFDNPEMRYGVTCYGKKPSQNSHDESAVAQGAPVSPDAVAFNQKVSKFKSEVDTIALSPFNGNSWNN